MTNPKELKPGDRIYYKMYGEKRCGRFVEYVEVAGDNEVWAYWGKEKTYGWVSLKNVELDTIDLKTFDIYNYD